MFAILQKIRGFIFPRICLSCGITIKESGPLFCLDCIASIAPLAETLCPICGARKSNMNTCHKGTIPLFAAFRYENEPIRRAIHALKYGGVESAAETLCILSAELFLTSPFAQQCRKDNIPIACVPIPLFPSRERERGYNQSALIAESLAQQLSLGGIRAFYIPNFLVRIKKTISQTELHSKEERKKNMEMAFITKNILFPSGSIVLLIDDVSTSGATLLSATHALRKIKIPHIAGFVVAKA